MIFHSHQWQETSRRFNESEMVPTKWESNSGNNVLLQILYGITVVELHCIKCGDIKAVRYIGNAT